MVKLLESRLSAWIAGFVIIAILGYIGVLHATIASTRAEFDKFKKENEGKIAAVTPADLQRLRNDLGTDIDRTLGGVRERVRLLEDRPQRTVVERTVERQTGPAGAAGRPGESIRGPAGTPGPTGRDGAPGATPVAPGTPLIPPAEQPVARQQAIEKIYLHFDPGTLVNCQAPTLDPDVVELLRDPTGRLSSTAPCIWRIADTVTLRQAPVSTQRLFAIRPYVGAGYVAGLWEAGIGADVLHLGAVSLGVDLRFLRPSPPPVVGLHHVVVGLSTPFFVPHLRLQAGAAIGINNPGGWTLGLTARW